MSARMPARVGRARRIAGIEVPAIGMRNEWHVGQKGRTLALHTWGDEYGVVGGNLDSPVEIVIIPGYSGDLRTCRILASMLFSQGCLVRSLNLPAHFGSPSRGGSLEEMSEYFVDALSKHSFGDKRLVICAASAASAPSWRVAIEFKDRLHSFVSVAGNDYRSRIPFERMVRGIPRSMLRSMLGGSGQLVNSPKSLNDVRRLFGYMANDLTMAWQIGHVAWDADAIRDIKEFGRLNLPLVLIGAEYDVTSPPWMFLKTYRLAKPRVSVMIPYAGHLFCTLEGSMAQDVVSTLLHRGMQDSIELGHLDAATADALTDWTSMQKAMDDITGRSTLDWISRQLDMPETRAELGIGLDLSAIPKY